MKTERLHLALLLIVFLLAATLPYAWLIANFGYDDILREPAANILRSFQAGGPALVGAWLAFALSSLVFIPVVFAVERLLPGPPSLAAPLLGVASALLQAIGLLRWVLVVPALAAQHADPATSAATRASIELLFQTVHAVGGNLIGEFLGQLLLAGWTSIVSLRLAASGLVPRALAWLGAATLPFWLMGQTELLQPVLPALPRLETVPLAFMAWEAWLALLAGFLLSSHWRMRRQARRLS